MITKVKYMIDEIFEEYKHQERETFLLMADHFGIGVKDFLSPHVNYDMIIIMHNVNLLKEEIDSFEIESFNRLNEEIDSIKIMDRIYEDTIKEGILLGIGFGKTHMIKKVLELEINKSEILDINLEEYYQYFPKFDKSKYDFEKTYEDGTERLIVSMKEKPNELEIEIELVSHITRIIDKNHKELKKILFEKFLDDFKIDRKKARHKFNKKIKIDSENLKPMLRSRFFKEQSGNIKIKRIIEEYLDYLIDIGLDIGIRVGLRLVIEDIQKEIMPYEILKNLSETETMMYIQKEHSDYILKKQNEGK